MKCGVGEEGQRGESARVRTLPDVKEIRDGGCLQGVQGNVRPITWELWGCAGSWI